MLPSRSGTATVSVVTPAGKVTDSLTGVNCVGTTESTSFPPFVREPSAAQKSIVSGRRLALLPVGAGRVRVTVSCSACWLMNSLGTLMVTCSVDEPLKSVRGSSASAWNEVRRFALGASR